MGVWIWLAEGCAASGGLAALVHCVVAAKCDGETDQRAGAHEGRTRPLVAPAAGTGELRRRRIWRRPRRSALSALWRSPDPGWPAPLTRPGSAVPAPPSSCSASLLTSFVLSTRPTIQVCGRWDTRCVCHCGPGNLVRKWPRINLASGPHWRFPRGHLAPRRT